MKYLDSFVVSTLVIFIKSKASVPSLAALARAVCVRIPPSSLLSAGAILGYSPQTLRAEPPGQGLIRSGGLRPAALALATRAARPSPPPGPRANGAVTTCVRHVQEIIRSDLRL